MSDGRIRKQPENQTNPVAPPSPPNMPGIIRQDLSNVRSSFDGLSEREQERMVGLMERYIALEEAKERNRHLEAMNKQNVGRGRQKLALASLFSVVIIVFSCFWYARSAEDNSLAEQVLAAMVGLLGGGSAAVAFLRDSDK